MQPTSKTVRSTTYACQCKNMLWTIIFGSWTEKIVILSCFCLFIISAICLQIFKYVLFILVRVEGTANIWRKENLAECNMRLLTGINTEHRTMVTDTRNSTIPGSVKVSSEAEKLLYQRSDIDKDVVVGQQKRLIWIFWRGQYYKWPCRYCISFPTRFFLFYVELNDKIFFCTRLDSISNKKKSSRKRDWRLTIGLSTGRGNKVTISNRAN